MPSSDGTKDRRFSRVKKGDGWTCGSEGTLGMDGKMPRLGAGETLADLGM